MVVQKPNRLAVRGGACDTPPGPSRRDLLATLAAIALLKGQKPRTTGFVDNNGKRLPAYIIPPETITKANYKILFNGYLKRSKVCVGQYAKFCT